MQDEEDEELVVKAKANRKSRIEQNKATTKKFLGEEGLKDIAEEKELIPIQRGILRLALSGAQIERGDIQGASSTLSDGWAKEFEVSLGNVGSNGLVTTKLSALQSAASKNDAGASRKAYVELVAELQSWTKTVGISDRLKGIN